MSITAPGKVILFGEHTVVYGCPALAASIDACITLTFRRHSSHLCRDLLFKINFKDFTDEPFILHRYDFVDEPVLGKPDADLLASFLSRSESLLSDFNMPKELIKSVAVILFSLHLIRDSNKLCNIEEPYELTFTSTLPINAGLGSSGAFCSVVAAFSLFLTGEIVNSELSSSDYMQIQSFAHKLEKFMHNSPSGVDTTVSVYGGLINFQRSDSKFVMHRIDVPNCGDLPNLVIINTNTPRSTAAVVESVRNFRHDNLETFNAVSDSITSICNEGLAILSKPLGTASLEYLSSLFSMNHKELCRLGVSNEILDEVVQRMESLCFGAKLTGAGRGGCVIALPSKKSDIVDTVKRISYLLKDLNVTVFGTTLCTAGIKMALYKD
ncbi:hypothetical protein Aperf_G00000021702 [Anoplocephala perfoliata]